MFKAPIVRINRLQAMRDLIYSVNTNLPALLKTLLVAAYTLFGSNVVFAGDWVFGQIQIAESYAEHVQIRWTGANSQSCASSVVRFDATTLGSADAFKRGFAIAMVASTTKQPIRFYLDGCINDRQRATVVQLCTSADCAY